MRTFCRFAVVMLLLVGTILQAEEKKTREQKVREDKERVEAEGFWMYNDISGAIAEAKKTGKPILVVLRCLPCEECVKLDDELVDQDPVIQKLLKEYVCVRVVGTNGLDLETFQYDTDQSFAVFLMNADKTIYGRFGTRSHRTEWVGDVSLKGMAKALERGLDIHAAYPGNKAELAGKRGDKPLFASPEKYPALRDKFTDALNYEGDVVKSCIHCHQIGDAERQYYRDLRKPIPEKVLFPYPHPKAVGLTLDPKECAKVVAVADGSPAAKAGFKAGDDILALQSQPIISMADVQWVLHNTAPEGGIVKAQVSRAGKPMTLSMSLEDGWRREGEIAWRVSSWGLRRMSTGGLKLDSTTPEFQQKAGVDEGEMALHVFAAGKYGPHAAARNAGFREGDILVSVNGRTDLLTEDDLLAYGVTECLPGQKLDAVVWRNGKRLTLKLPIQE
ncbi:MAG: Trx7/PDZ domain-containing (seleno)protein [Planctomycetaceae bacterium]